MYLILEYNSFCQMREHLSMVSNEIRVRHVGQLLAVMIRILDWGSHSVGDDCKQKIDETNLNPMKTGHLTKNRIKLKTV